ncbi:tRNA (N(6)-L-threonylcarbamoyladenosine(37)-C(2))-methylthiotransferase [Candidatus Woesearchaeota archaeon]|nr:tRNA (N(6)-L-threonylcarbamoyladenosine(37)-C(2))-methylthiotransferase [Candidatus Woesearchaeota archaeon]
MANVCLVTYGCTANQDNSDIIKGILNENKHYIIQNAESADVVIINSCVVKGVTANKVKSAVEKFRNKKLIITGCMAESEQKLLKRIAPKASLVNTFHITKINDAVNGLMNNRVDFYIGKRKENILGLPKLFNENKISLQIAQGCTSACNFCETKLAKGYVKSYSEEEIAKELKRYLKLGHKKINITSTDNGCYGLDLNTNLPRLLKKLAAVNGRFSLRVGMMNPEHVKKFLDGLIDAYKDKKIIKFLHVPVQSGSDKVLKEMNRNYSIKDFKEIVKRFRKEFHKIDIITDVIAGYPSESEDDFSKTVSLIEEIKPDVLNISKYSPRPGTTSARLRQLSTHIVKERTRILTNGFKKLKKMKNNG